MLDRLVLEGVVMAKKASGRTWMAKLRELMVAACWRLKEESTHAEVVLVIVGTGGRNGSVEWEFGQANPSAAYGVLMDAVAQFEVKYGIGDVTEEPEGEDA